jgi:ABC-type antimicrobial peptide transport system permease subunit
VRSILATRLRVSTGDEEAIRVASAADALKQIPIDDMQGLFLILAVTTLVIGGVGVMNMMLDSVQERRSEIGVRLAVGARRRDVVAQFFLETVAMTGIGGLAGVGLGIAGSLALGSLQVPDVVPIPVLQGWAVTTAVCVMTGVGVLAGLIPAWRAARVDPSLILRVE